MTHEIATIVNTFPLHANALWKDMCEKNYGQVHRKRVQEVSYLPGQLVLTRGIRDIFLSGVAIGKEPLIL